MNAVPRNDVIAFVAGSLAGESPLSIEDAVAAALRLLDEFDDHGWSIRVGDPRIEHDLSRNEIRVEFGGVDLTPAFVAVGGAVYDVVPRGGIPKCPDASEVIAGAVEATLNYVSTWHDETERDDYRARAEQVRTYAEIGWRESPCCPVCSEIVCDDDCPLYLVRDAAGVWVGSTGASSDVEEPEVDDWPADAVFSREACAQAEQAVDAALLVEIDEPAEDVETVNDHMVSIQGTGETARFRWLGSNGVSQETALRHAAWIVAMGDPLDERFPTILRAVKST